MRCSWVVLIWASQRKIVLLFLLLVIEESRESWLGLWLFVLSCLTRSLRARQLRRLHSVSNEYAFLDREQSREWLVSAVEPIFHLSLVGRESLRDWNFRGVSILGTSWWNAGFVSIVNRISLEEAIFNSALYDWFNYPINEIKQHRSSNIWLRCQFHLLCLSIFASLRSLIFFFISVILLDNVTIHEHKSLLEVCASLLVNGFAASCSIGLVQRGKIAEGWLIKESARYVLNNSVVFALLFCGLRRWRRRSCRSSWSFTSWLIQRIRFIQAISRWLLLAHTVHISVSFVHLVFKFVQFLVTFHLNINQSRCSIASEHWSFFVLLIFVETILVSYGFCDWLDMFNLIFSDFLDSCFTSFDWRASCFLSRFGSSPINFWYTNCWLLRSSTVLT